MGGSKTVLIFDDDSSIVDILTYIFEERGWKVHSSEDSTNVLEKIDRYHPDLIMMDNNIPDCGGIVATQTIKKQENLHNIPVIFFSAHADVKALSWQAGADYYLAKPFGLAHINNMIDQLFGNSPVEL
ncbi:response regulator [Mucilaginibacter sp.]|uniref:response regulator n=1 Tax=Mucilaginibacter sp. TaxID=1882438 RepID=UPI0032637C77